MWPTKLLQSPNDDSFRPTDRENTGDYLHWRHHHAVTIQKRNVHHHQWISHPSAEGWVKNCVQDKTFFFLKKVKFLGQVISPDVIQPIAKRVDALRNLRSPQSKWYVMKVLGGLGSYSCYIHLHVDSHPFYNLIKHSTPFHWTEEHETLFKSIKERIHKATVLAVPSTDYPFHIHVDSSNVGTGCILFQQFPEGKRIISFNSRVLDKAEQEIYTLHRELCGIVSALQTYEH